jgi:hypothetical protein
MIEAALYSFIALYVCSRIIGMIFDSDVPGFTKWALTICLVVTFFQATFIQVFLAVH